MKKLNHFITEKLKLNKDFKNIEYSPKNKDELKELVNKLIKERGNEADLNDIDTSKITDMSRLFFNSDFNGDISKWNVSNVEYMNGMFRNSKFNGDISNWNIENIKTMYNMFEDSPLEKNPPAWYKD